MSALDTQIGGSHYKSMPIQPMEFSMANDLDACQHTIIKYVARFREKGGIQDLEKAKHVIDMLIEFEGKSQVAAKELTGDKVAPLGTRSDRNKATEVAKPRDAQAQKCSCLVCQITEGLNGRKRFGNA